MSTTLQSLLRCGSIEDIGLALRWDPAVLVDEVTRRATILSQMGIGRGSKVAIAHSGSARFFADLFAVWTVGATAACLDGTLTSTELEIVSGFMEPAAVLVDRSAPSGELSLPILELATCRPSRVETIFIDPALDDPALVLFTSGTTGSPKGVVLSFRALRMRVELNIAAIGTAALKRALVTLPTHFGHGLIGNALTPLMAGGDIVLSPRGTSLADDLGRIIDEHQISFMSSVPSLWHIVKRSSRPPSGGSLKRVHVGSAPLSARSWSEIAAWSQAEVVNSYGMTETANWISGASSRSDGIADGLLGKPWGGAASVIDDDGSIQATGTGEIIVKSPSLMSGYLKREDLTTAAMIDGWFRTGDRGTVDELGRIWLTGRIKDEINRAGFKVQPAEIDMLLETHPAIAETCVFAVPDPISGESVGAAIRLAKGGNLDIGSLRSWCRERLRREAVPDRWFIVDHIPRNARGKVNRDALRKTLLGASEGAQCISETPDHAVSDHSRTVRLTSRAETSTNDALTVRVRNAVERAWTASLDEQSFQANMPWEDAGGDSLKALQLLLHLEDTLGQRLSTDVLSVGMTPSSLSTAIERWIADLREGVTAHEVGDARTTVFLMPGILYDELGLARFRHALGDRIRFVLIGYPNWRETIAAKADFDAIVTAALAQILSQCGDRPIYLAGYSFGGFVAYAAAHRLVESGRRVAFLGLLDTRRRSRFAALPLASAIRSMKVIDQILYYVKAADTGVLFRIILRIFLEVRAFVLLEAFARLCMSMSGRRADPDLLFVLRSYALQRWLPNTLSVPTFFFRSEDNPQHQPHDCGWSTLCPLLSVVPIEGDHSSMLAPGHIERLCATFLEALHAADHAGNRSRA